MEKTIITISRQYGSGGRDTGKALAKKLGITFYDKELLYVAAEKGNIHPDIAKDADENVKKGFFGLLSSSPYMAEAGVATGGELPINDRLYIMQSNLIKELAEQSSCIIVGRCADYILADNPNVVNVFIHANEESRVKRIMWEAEITSEKEARKLMEKTDKRRATYYNYYSSNKWGRADNYHLSIDSCIGVEGCASLIESYIKLRNQES